MHSLKLNLQLIRHHLLIDEQIHYTISKFKLCHKKTAWLLVRVKFKRNWYGRICSRNDFVCMDCVDSSIVHVKYL